MNERGGTPPGAPFTDCVEYANARSLAPVIDDNFLQPIPARADMPTAVLGAAHEDVERRVVGFFEQALLEPR